MQTRSDLGVGIPDAVFVTGNQWPDEVKDFKITAYGMKDYKLFRCNLEVWYDLLWNIIEEKGFQSAAAPTLINTAFGSFFQGTEFTALRNRICKQRKNFLQK